YINSSCAFDCRCDCHVCVGFGGDVLRLLVLYLYCCYSMFCFVLFFFMLLVYEFLFFFFFFFFQAEDGIRDPLVTGVQTCALPISGRFVGLRLHPAFNRLWPRLRKERTFKGDSAAAMKPRLSRLPI